MGEPEFIAAVTEGQVEAPRYFGFSARHKMQARPLRDEDSSPDALTVDQALAHQAGGAMIIDTRNPDDFALGHLRGAVNVGLDGRFAEYAGDVIRPEQAVVVLADGAEAAAEATMRLGRIGFDRVLGALTNPAAVLLARPDLVEPSARITAAALAERLVSLPDLQVVDVRNVGETEVGMIPGAELMPLPRLVDRLAELDPKRPTVVHCAGGYRSSVAASLLRANGFSDVSDLIGGYNAWAASAHAE